MANEFDGRVKVVVEEFGNSPMATKFGVRRYPVVFVDDVLVARPKDFGFGGAEDVSGGLYVPWLDPANQRKFKADLRRAGYREVKGRGKGSHSMWEHPLVADSITLSGHDGADAHDYQERMVREFVERARAAEKEQAP